MAHPLPHCGEKQAVSIVGCILTFTKSVLDFKFSTHFKRSLDVSSVFMVCRNSVNWLHVKDALIALIQARNGCSAAKLSC